jgi:hypothetical protein
VVRFAQARRLLRAPCGTRVRSDDGRECFLGPPTPRRHPCPTTTATVALPYPRCSSREL